MLEKNKKNDFLIKQLCEDSNYVIHRDGSIFTFISKNGKITKHLRAVSLQSPKKTYLKIHYKKKQLFVHRVIFCKFNKHISSHLDINHIDGNKQNNSFENLEQTTRSLNLVHSYRILGRRPKIQAAILSRIGKASAQKSEAS